MEHRGSERLLDSLAILELGLEGLEQGLGLLAFYFPNSHLRYQETSINPITLSLLKELYSLNISPNPHSNRMQGTVHVNKSETQTNNEPNISLTLGPYLD